MDNGSFANGEQKLYWDAAQPRCVRVASPWGWFAYDRPNFLFNFWHGTLLEDKQDRAGTAYRRNRQYDPYSGRFTQEDPIGLAGGLNAYGFARVIPYHLLTRMGLPPATSSREDAQFGNMRSRACSSGNRLQRCGMQGFTQ